MGPRVLNVIQKFFGLFLIVSIVAEQLGWKPPTVTGNGKPLMDAIIESGYIFLAIRVVYVLAGTAFLVNRFAPLSAVVLFPISVNILLFHSVLHPPSIPQALVFFVLNCLVLYANRAAYGPLIRSRPAKPSDD